MPFINVFVNDELHQALKDLSRREHRPMYAVIPDLLAEGAARSPQATLENLDTAEYAAKPPKTPKFGGKSGRMSDNA